MCSFQIPSHLLPSHSEAGFEVCRWFDRLHLDHSDAHLHSVDHRLRSESVRGAGPKVRGVHDVLAKCRDRARLHDGRLPDVLPHTAALHRNLLLAHWHPGLETQSPRYARHQSTEEHPQIQDPNCTHVGRGVRHLCVVLVAPLLYQPSNRVRLDDLQAREAPLDEVPHAIRAVVRSGKQLCQSICVLLL